MARRVVSDIESPDLTCSLEKLCYVVVKAREFDVKEEVVEPEPGSNPSDDRDVEILEDYADDPTAAELAAAIDGMNEDEKIELLALVWVGRGDYGADEWETALSEATAVHDARETAYLMGIPNLGDLIEDGLAAIGYSCEESEMGHL